MAYFAHLIDRKLSLSSVPEGDRRETETTPNLDKASITDCSKRAEVKLLLAP